MNNEVICVGLEPEDFKRLQSIKTQLFDDSPMTPDRRRDIANAMSAILNRSISFIEGDTLMLPKLTDTP